MPHSATLAVRDGAALVLDGTVGFAQADAVSVQTFDLPFAGSPTIVQKGAGTLAWASDTPPAAIRAEAGTLCIGGKPDLSDTAFAVSGAAAVNLPDAVPVAVASAELDGQGVKAGDYVAGYKALGRHVTGAGTLRVLTGVGPGFSIIVR